jgi:hypothetical protein
MILEMQKCDILIPVEELNNLLIRLQEQGFSEIANEGLVSSKDVEIMLELQEKCKRALDILKTLP